MALQELIVKTARWRYLDANPLRKRVPNGFEHDLKLKISALEDGSVKPVIRFLPVAGAALLLNFQSKIQPYYVDAVDSIHAAAAAAGSGETSNQVIRGHLPEDLLGLFDRVGRGLSERESLALPDRHGAEVRLTLESRRVLVRASGKQTFTEEVVLFGEIAHAAQDRARFDLRILNGPTLVNVAFGEPNAEAVVKAFSGWKEGVRVRVAGVARMDRGGEVVGLDSVDEVAVLEARDVQARLVELAALEPGWDADGEAEALHKEHLDVLAIFFDAYWPESVSLPVIFPSVGNGLHLEFEREERRAEMEIDLNNLTAEWFAFVVGAEGEETAEFDFLNGDGSNDFEAFVEAAEKWLGASA